MKPTILLLSSLGCARAAWLRWTVNHDDVWAPKETGSVTEDQQLGWTPKPTPAPGVRSESDEVLNLFRRQSTKTNWTNSETCGWFSGISSSAFTCGGGYSCATNKEHAVACASGTIAQFFTACLDYSAFQAGSCSNLDAATGCCQQKTQPACGTYIWSGQPERFMYQCFETASIVSMLDVPQFVIDASIYSKTHTTPKPTITITSTGTGTRTSTKTDIVSNGSPSQSPSAHQSQGGNPGSPPSNSSSDSNNTTIIAETNNTPVIVGGVVGGIAVLILLLLLILCGCRRKGKGNQKKRAWLWFGRSKKDKGKNAANEYHTTNNINVEAAKGGISSGSETTIAPMARQPQPQPVGGQGPVPSVSYANNTSYMTAAAGVIPMAQQRSIEPQQQYPPQQTVPAQMQPVNHIHVYYGAPPPGAPPARDFNIATVSSQTGQSTNTTAQAGSSSRGNAPRRPAHSRDVSAATALSRPASPSFDRLGGAGGPGYRQSM